VAPDQSVAGQEVHFLNVKFRSNIRYQADCSLEQGLQWHSHCCALLDEGKVSNREVVPVVLVVISSAGWALRQLPPGMAVGIVRPRGGFALGFAAVPCCAMLCFLQCNTGARAPSTTVPLCVRFEQPIQQPARLRAPHHGTVLNCAQRPAFKVRPFRYSGKLCRGVYHAKGNLELHVEYVRCP